MFGPAIWNSLPGFYQVSGCASVVDASFLETARSIIGVTTGFFFFYLFISFLATRSEPADVLIIVVWCIESFPLLGVQKKDTFVPPLFFSKIPANDVRPRTSYLREVRRKNAPSFLFQTLWPSPFLYSSYFLHIINDGGMNFNWAKTKWHLFVNISHQRRSKMRFEWTADDGVMICTWKDEFCILHRKTAILLHPSFSSMMFSS